jgi:Spy/CpxP family protein refolding chaperone
MQNKHIIIGTVALLIIGGIVLNTVVEARVAPIGTKFAARHSDGMQDRMIQKLMKRVELTDRQREAAHGIIDAYRPEFDALRDEMRTNGFRLLDISPDHVDYERVVTEVGRSSGELVVEMVEAGSRMRSDLYGILTADQRVRAAELKAEIREEVIELIGIIDPEFDPVALVSGR